MNAESSTMKQVRGDFSAVACFSTSSITLLQCGDSTNLERQIRSHFAKRHDRISVSFFHCYSWHPVHCAALLVLCDGMTTGILNLPETLSPVATHAGHYDPGCQ